MKKLLITLFTFCIAYSSSAYDYQYLSFELSDGSVQSMSVADLTLTFSNGNLISSDGTTIPLSNLSKMYFSETSKISVISDDSFIGKVDVFLTSGSKVGTFSTPEEAKSELPKGIYIMKSEQGTIQKIAIR